MKHANISKGRLWTARIMKGIVILFMLFDGIGKLAKPEAVIKGTLDLGYAEHHIAIIGVLALLCTVLYAIPRTQVLGALLLTGFFGGTVASQLRVDAPLFTNILFSIYLAILAWGAVWLRDERVRKLLTGRLD
jgi:hypothetical protein